MNTEVTEINEAADSVNANCLICPDAPVALNGDALNRRIIARLPFSWYDLGFAASIVIGGIMTAVHVVAR